jgi:hypothetical protein
MTSCSICMQISRFYNFFPSQFSTKTSKPFPSIDPNTAARFFPSCFNHKYCLIIRYYDNKKLQWVLTGIVSFGQKKCGTEGFPAVYTNVSVPDIQITARQKKIFFKFQVTNYLDWIEKNISDGDDEETIKFD